MKPSPNAAVWVFKTEHGGWWNEAVVNGHVLTVGPSTQHMWSVAVDGKRIGRRSSQTSARELAMKAVK